MRPAGSSFLPERLRPRLRLGRRPRRRPATLLVVVPLLLALLPWWRIHAVEVEGLAPVPAAVASQLDEYLGVPALGIDLRQVRDRLEAWPGIDGADVRLELPGRLRVVARPARPAASLQIGRGWHGVALDGTLTGVVAAPVAPELDGFPAEAGTLRTVLVVVRRVQAEARAEVLAVRRVAPDDLELLVRPAAGGEPLTVVVGREPSGAERYWSARVAAGEPPGAWCDARAEERLVVGGAA